MAMSASDPQPSWNPQSSRPVGASGAMPSAAPTGAKASYESLLPQLTVDEAASLTSGGDAWHTQGVARLGIPGITMCDGPHGLRKDLDGTGAVPATCFPPAATLASSWDPALARTVGDALAEECLQEGVSLVLGPAINIKRNPLGGRCFEYWSEDPFLAGHEAAGLVDGLQTRGVGATLKHFAVNSQETDRLRVDARLSERALREIYLPAFEYVVRRCHPWAVMCCYNRVNGAFGAQNKALLTDILRGEWGFEGVVMSDWGACHDRVASVNAGLNLEMPPSGTDSRVAEAARDGRVARPQLDAMAGGVLRLADKARPALEWAARAGRAAAGRGQASQTAGGAGYRYDSAIHHAIARHAAAESMVLLKNDDGLLPLDPRPGGRRLAVIGEFARSPRYQGGGSSHINPTRVSSFLDALRGRGIEAAFAPGFALDDGANDGANAGVNAGADGGVAGDDAANAGAAARLRDEAVAAARGADVALLFLGLPESAESEGFDRTAIDLPADQIELLHAVARANPNTVAVLANGSVVSVAPWRNDARAILETWLPGQAGGEAVADVLFGDANPSGRLAQSIPMDIADDPTMIVGGGRWTGEEGHVDYGEGVFVGYRHYDTAGVPVAYEFGYGLGYSRFELADIRVERLDGGGAGDGEGNGAGAGTGAGAGAGAGAAESYGTPIVRVSAIVRNLSDRDGADVVQVYVAPPSDSPVARPAHELKGFAKVAVPAHGAAQVVIDLDARAFSYWSERYHAWHLEAGEYRVQVGESSRRIAASIPMRLDGDGLAARLDGWSTFEEWSDDPVGAQVVAALRRRCEAGEFPALPDDSTMLLFLRAAPVNSLTMIFGEDGSRMGEWMLAEYARLTRTDA